MSKIVKNQIRDSFLDNKPDKSDPDASILLGNNQEKPTDNDKQSLKFKNTVVVGIKLNDLDVIRQIDLNEIS